MRYVEPCEPTQLQRVGLDPSAVASYQGHLDLSDVVGQGRAIESKQLDNGFTEEIIFDVLDPLFRILPAPLFQNVYYLLADRSVLMDIAPVFFLPASPLLFKTRDIELNPVDRLLLPLLEGRPTAEAP